MMVIMQSSQVNWMSWILTSSMLIGVYGKSKNPSKLQRVLLGLDLYTFQGMITLMHTFLFVSLH